MATVIEMPKLSDTMDSGTIVAWTKKEGDAIQAGEVIAEVESDKATMELEAYETGILRQVLVQVGESVPVGKPIAIVSQSPDEDVSSLIVGQTMRAPAPAEELKPEAQAAPSRKAPESAKPPAVPAQTSPTPDEGGRATVSPLVARMARELGLDLSMIKGTGPGGRIVKRDIEKAQ